MFFEYIYSQNGYSKNVQYSLHVAGAAVCQCECSEHVC